MFNRKNNVSEAKANFIVKNGPWSTNNQRIKHLLGSISVATNNPFCERIVLRIPKSRSDDYSSILHTYKKIQMFVSDWSNSQDIELRVAVIHDKHISKKFHQF